MDDVMTDQEAREYFNQMCQEFFGVSGQEFMDCPYVWSNDPHFESVMFLVDLWNNCEHVDEDK